MSNKVILVLIFIGFLGSTLATKASNDKFSSQLLNFVQSDYTVDKVLQLLKDIKIAQQGELETLIANWRESEPILQAAITAASEALENQTDLCEDIETLLNSNIAERDRTLALIEEARNKIQSNLHTIQEQEELRCQANLIFINKVRENNQAIKFLIYLRTRITDPAFKDYLENNRNVLLEISAGMKSDEKNTLGLLTKAHLMAQLQVKSKKSAQPYEGHTKEELEATYNVDSRTEEEIGTGHIDNNQGGIDREGYDQVIRDIDLFIGELVNLIDQLISELEESTRALNEAEGEANYNLGVFLEQVELENTVLNGYISAWNAYVDELNIIIANNQNAYDECTGHIPRYEATLAAARENYESQKSGFDARRVNILNTISMLDSVIEIYETKVVNAAATYKDRVEDYVEDDQKVFDKTDYEHRGSSEDIDRYEENNN